MRSRTVAVLAALLTLAVAAPAALADGDPASDYLLAQSTFLSPYDAHMSSSCQSSLIGMVASAQKQGLPLKVAVIATQYDLGAVPILFGKPQLYSKFLAEEDYYYWRSELLVVMPNGYGVYKAKGLPAADTAAIAKLPKVATIDAPLGERLCVAAQDGVKALAARRGLTLSTTAVGSSGSSETQERFVIAGAALAAVAVGFALRFFWRRRRAH